MQFNITFERYTPESLETGDVEETGFYYYNIGLREAYDFLRFTSSDVEADSWPVKNPRWLTFYNANEDFETGETTNYCLHIPKNLTEATKIRIARLFNCYGAK